MQSLALRYEPVGYFRIQGLMSYRPFLLDQSIPQMVKAGVGRR